MKRMGFACCMSPRVLLTPVALSSLMPTAGLPILPATLTGFLAKRPVETSAKTAKTEDFRDGKIVLSGLKETTWISRTERGERTPWV
jgi:hypothetical protein